jgi:GDPmannose 4,6-dehydratase
VGKLEPDEVYNLAAQSHVSISYDIPEYTANVNGLGALRILDAIRDLKIKCRYYQASSSEMFGKVLEIPQDERTPFNPQSPYACAKVFAFNITKVYRESYHLFASNGILFNHESPRRGINFVTRKITQGLSRVRTGVLKELKLGNLEAVRDWGYAKDYVEAIWMIIQHHKPDDMVIATGETHTVREFVEETARCLGMNLVWKGRGLKEVGVNKKTGKVIVRVDPRYFRKAEVECLQGNAAKAFKEISWKPKTSFKQLVEIMAKCDYDAAAKEAKLGYKIEVQEARDI